MKLLALAQHSTLGGVPTTFTGGYIYTMVALLSLATILVSVVNLVAYDEWFIPIEKDLWGGHMIVRRMLFLVGLCTMALVFVVILLTAEEVGADHSVEIYLFLLSWIGYPLVYILMLFEVPFWLPDLLFAPLDVFAKAVFGLWVAQKAWVP